MKLSTILMALTIPINLYTFTKLRRTNKVLKDAAERIRIETRGVGRG